jgi:hypothetical protein
MLFVGVYVCLKKRDYLPTYNAQNIYLDKVNFVQNRCGKSCIIKKRAILTSKMDFESRIKLVKYYI